MNSLEIVYYSLKNRKPLPRELSIKSEAVWQQWLQELVASEGQEILDLIFEYLSVGEISQDMMQSRWELFLARSMLAIQDVPVDVFEKMATRYIEIGIYLVENEKALTAMNDKSEADFFSRLYEIKQLVSLDQKLRAQEKLNEIKTLFPHVEKIIEHCETNGIFFSNKKKVAFFVKPQMDSFLGDIIECLRNDYEIKKCIVTETKQINEGMEWADICWFEWCDELVIYGSQLEEAKRKRIICRLHSYEAFSEYPSQVKWENVEKVIFVANHIRDFVLENTPALRKEQTKVIPNGVDLEKYTYKERKHGFNIAYVGYINYKKGPMLLLHAFKAIYDKDKRYKLFIAGQFQDPRDVLYFKQMVKEWNLENNIIFQGWQDDLNTWLEDKNYILCTSLLESQNMSVMQAMAKGIKPLIHNFVGAVGVYKPEYIWNTFDELTNMINSKAYDYREYRKFIQDRYPLSKAYERIRLIIAN